MPQLKAVPVELFTPETASKLSKIGWEKKRARDAELLEAEKELKTLRIALAKTIPASDTCAKALSLEEELASIRAGMIGADADTKAKLATAYAKLFSAWCVLTDTKSPGTSRGSRRQRLPGVEPIGAAAGSDHPQELPRGSAYWDYDGL